MLDNLGAATLSKSPATRRELVVLAPVYNDWSAVGLLLPYSTPS
jgi:hypothetical protein